MTDHYKSRASTHGRENWAANPWVWVIEFKKLEQKEQA